MILRYITIDIYLLKMYNVKKEDLEGILIEREGCEGTNHIDYSR